jgi:putative protein kinase ArgK-like GTPase of G3E family
MTCSSVEGTSIEDVWSMVLEYEQASRSAGAFTQRRDRQLRDWMHRLIDDMLKARLRDNPEARALLQELEETIAALKSQVASLQQRATLLQEEVEAASVHDSLRLLHKPLAASANTLASTASSIKSFS